MEDKAKIERCKYSHPHFKNNSIEYHCVVDIGKQLIISFAKKTKFLKNHGACQRGRNKKESEKALFYIQFILSTNTPKKHFLSN